MKKSNTTDKNRSSTKALALRGALLVALLFAAVSPAQADSARDRFGGSQWRLGSHNQIFLRTDRGWQRVQGSAIAVADGWVIGTDRRDGGYGIYRWNGRSFNRMPGAAVDIGGSYERPWVINNRGERFEWTGRDWREVRSYGSNRNSQVIDRRYDRNDNDDHDRRDNKPNDHHNERRRPSW